MAAGDERISRDGRRWRGCRPHRHAGLGGHHTAKHSHQRAQVGGVLRSAVEELLQQYEYEYYPGKDRAGHSGAFLVVARGQMSMR